jgi:HK97 family phage major capsid protein
MFNLKQWFMLQLMMCFRFFDEPNGTGGDTATIPKEFNMDDLKGIIREAVKEENAEGVENLKKEILAVNRKSIFPFQAGEFGTDEVSDISQKSIIDTTVFNRQFSMNVPNNLQKLASKHPALPAGVVLGNELVQCGGPFKRLSPAMEVFGNFIKCGADLGRAQAAGLDIKEHNLSVKEHYKQAGLNEGVLGQGGVFVPPEWSATVIEFATQQSQILSQVWRLPMNSNVLRIPRLVQAAGSYFGGVVFYTPGEGDTKESTMPEFEQLSFEARKLVGIIYLTDELIQDSIINIVNYVTGLYTRAFQYEVERRIINGLGGAAGGPCTGIVADPAINTVPRNTANTVVFQDIVNLDNSIDESFTNLTWITRKVAQNTLMGIRDLNNRPIYFADYGDSQSTLHPPKMYGYPVFRTRNVPQLGVKGDIILGDLSWYLLAMRQDLQIDQSIHVRFLQDELTLRFVMRFDGAPAISIAFSVLDDVAS